VSHCKIPLSLGATISFFSLTLSYVNAGARVMLPMGEHGFFPTQLRVVHVNEHDPTRRNQRLHRLDAGAGNSWTARRLGWGSSAKLTRSEGRGRVVSMPAATIPVAAQTSHPRLQAWVREIAKWSSSQVR
jgi:hypothetical protein